MTPVSPQIAPDRELAVTGSRHSVVFRLRHLLCAVALAACGGGRAPSKDTYTRATDVQGACCEHLKGDGRTQCLQQVVRVDDAAVAKSDLNQQTYTCVVDHFTCDPASGHPTQESAQAQLECIQALEGTTASN
jgi:hypothetical protein